MKEDYIFISPTVYYADSQSDTSPLEFVGRREFVVVRLVTYHIWPIGFLVWF